MIPVVVGSNPIIHPTFPIPEAWAQDLFFDSPVPQTLQSVADGLKLLEVNRAYEQLLGYSREELIGRDPLDFHDPQDAEMIRGERSRFLSNLASRSSDRTGFQGEMRGRYMISRQGVKRHYVLFYRWFRSHDGQEVAHCSLFDNSMEVRAQQMLEQQLAQRARNYDQAPVGMMTLDSRLMVMRINRALLRQLGLNAHEVLGRQEPFGPLGDPEAREILARHWNRVAATDKLVQARVRITARNGKTYWFDLHSRAVGDEGDHQGFLTIVVNVTGEHVLAGELRKVVLQQSALLRHAGAGIAYIDDGRLIRVNSMFAQMLGQSGTLSSDTSLIGKQVSEVLRSSPDWVEIQEQAITALQTEPAFHSRIELVNRGDAPLPCQLSLQYLDPLQPGVGLILTLVDLTPSLELNKVSAALERSEDVLEQLGDSVDDAVLVVDRRLSKIFYSNPMLPQHFGLSETQLRADPRRLLTVLSESQGEELLNALAVVRKGRRAATELLVTVPGKMTKRLLRVRLSVLRNSDDFVLMIAEDVTEQRESEKQRELELLQQRDHLIREVHHRIKNNLQGVAGLLQQVAHTRPELATALGETANQIYAIAQVHGLQINESDELRPASLLTGLCEVFRRGLSDEAVLTLEIAEETPGVGQRKIAEAEAVPLALMLNELIGNALRHSTEIISKNVTVKLAYLGESTCLFSVINPGHLPESFKFVSVRSAASGLGLVKAMLPRQGAKLRFHATGSAVLVELELGPPVIKNVS